ncbi:peptide-methionine (S)-S-oxide reductase MsrA [bacterium]|nr:peptide-methionine (S)-S-oxide reductase MsrA [bacterium]
MKDGRDLHEAMFAGGCFWCLQPAFELLAGVHETAVGFAGGDVEAPTYEQVCAGGTGHREVLHLFFSPSKTTYEELLQVYWMTIDPTQGDGQFADRGHHYTTAIFTYSEEQRQCAERSRDELEKSGIFPKPIQTEILPAEPFFPAEASHQHYAEKQPLHYQAYAVGSGRKAFQERLSPALRSHFSRPQDDKFQT